MCDIVYERWSFGRIRLLGELQKSFEGVASYSPASITLSGLGDADPELLRVLETILGTAETGRTPRWAPASFPFPLSAFSNRN